MTLQEIKESKKDVLTPEDIAEVLDQDPQCLRINLREHPDWFEFPKYRKCRRRQDGISLDGVSRCRRRCPRKSWCLRRNTRKMPIS